MRLMYDMARRCVTNYARSKDASRAGKGHICSLMRNYNGRKRPWGGGDKCGRIQQYFLSYFAPIGMTPLEPTPTGMWSKSDCNNKK